MPEVLIDYKDWKEINKKAEEVAQRNAKTSLYIPTTSLDGEEVNIEILFSPSKEKTEEEKQNIMENVGMDEEEAELIAKMRVKSDGENDG